MSIRDMVTRHSDFDETKDFIPTPPWATRALYEFAWPDLKKTAPDQIFWDPAAGHGHMMGVAREYGHPIVKGTDVTPSLEHSVSHGDFTQAPDDWHTDVIVTNPPYKLLNEFIREGLHRARDLFALLVRVQALEGQRRYNEFFSVVPPTQIAFFSDRIPFKSGVVARKASKMFFHTWLVWDTKAIRQKQHAPRPPMWMPPNAQQLLERDEDYE